MPEPSKPLIDRRNKVIMYFSLKAGCTVALRMFYEHMGLLGDLENYKHNNQRKFQKKVLWEHRYRYDVFYRRFGFATPKEVHDPSYFKFKVVRNPYTRAVSGYIHAATYAFFGGSFARFASSINKDDLRACNPHWRVQRMENPKIFNKLVKIENLYEDIQEVNRLTGCNFKTDFTSYHHLHKTDETKFVGFKVFKKNHKKDPPTPEIPDYKYFYNTQIKQDIGRAYRRDIIAYGYRFPCDLLGSKD